MKQLKVSGPFLAVLGAIILLAILVGGLGFAPASGAYISATSDQAKSLQPIVIHSSRNDASPPLTELISQATALPAEEYEVPRGSEVEYMGDGYSDPAAVQNQLLGNLYMPLPIANFEGVSNADNYPVVLAPPDTEGDIGYDPLSGHKFYMQWNNISLQAWDVTDPNNPVTVLGPAPGNSLFVGFGGECENTNNGDPIVLFDHLANRWLATQFAVPASAPFYECVAVSLTGDPSGAWHRYEFEWPNGFNDYPKFGVWPDAYYMSANQFTGATGAGVAALERSQMLIGAPAQMIYFDISAVDARYRSLLPADLDGPPPPAGTPNFFTAWHEFAPGDTMYIWEFDVDFTTPANSTFGLSSLPNQGVPTANVDTTINAIPQPGGWPVDTLAPRLMFRLAYRYMDGQHIMVTNHTVDADSTNHAGVHWMELRSSGGPWSMFQEGVYAPDDDHRWMGSAAMDSAGNIAVGYSVSSETVFPSIRYAGRFSTDPLGTLPIIEAELVAGNGYQEGLHGRWGDYSAMGVDPVDDCTFWYTQEYYELIGDRPWQTRIGSFVFPNCLGYTGNLNGTITEIPGNLPLEGVKVEATSPMTQTAVAYSNAAGEYAFVLGSGSYTVTASAYGYQPVTVTSVPVISSGTTTQDLNLTAENFYQVDGTVRDSSGSGWPLYAHITVYGNPFDPPVPYNSFWTDPVTGYYSITLAAGINYTFEVEAFSIGYESVSQPIGPLTMDLTQDFVLQADSNLCQPPGYDQTTSFFTDFEANDGGFVAGAGEWEWGIPTFPPALVNVGAHSGVNVWGTDLDQTADDEVPGDHHELTATLTIPAGGGILQWWDWFGTGDNNNQRQVWVDGTLVWDDGITDTSQNYWFKRAIDVSAWAGQTVPVEFKLYVSGANPGPQGWYIDDVAVAEAGSCAVMAGGLVVGNVYDIATMDPLVGAIVTNDTGQTAEALDTPDDPLLDDAFYTIFSIAGPSKVFSATLPPYTPGVDTLSITANTVLLHDFLLAIHDVSLSGVQALGGGAGSTITYDIDITNEGNVTDTFDLALSGNNWTSTLSVAQITLNPGEMGSFTVEVDIPNNANGGDMDVVNVTATSQANGAATASLDLTTTAEDFLMFLPVVLLPPD